MKSYFEKLAKSLFDSPFQELSKQEQKVVQSIAEDTPIAENPNEKFLEQLTLGDRISDRIATFVGSWTFINGFLVFLIFWMCLNSFIFASLVQTFDPYPFILLNLALSTLAAIQAPVIMMSQNRQAAKDKVKSTLNYEVSLKTDLEIIRLHEKLDALMKSQDVEIREDGHP